MRRLADRTCRRAANTIPNLQSRNPKAARTIDALLFPTRRGTLFDGGEKATEVGKKHGEVERNAQLSYGNVARFRASGSGDAGAKRFWNAPMCL